MGLDDDFDEADDDFEEDEAEDEDEEEEREERSKRKRPGSQFIDDAAEEDDEEDEEDEAPRKKKGGGSGGYKRSVFVDDVAAVASDDEEEEEEEEDGFIDKDVDIPEEVEGEHRRAQRTLLPQEDELDEQAYEKFLEERYARAEDVGDIDDLEATEVEQQALLPSVTDPKLWIVKCQLGHEREAVISLMQKYVNLDEEGKAPRIKSAIMLDNLKGMIYVESEKEAYVKEACAGLRLLYTWKISLVPIREMAGVLTVEQMAVDLDVGSWVRVKIGLYKGDLAQVTDVDSVRQRALVKLIPRIDLQALAEKQDGLKVAKRSIRPAPRFFSVDEAKTYELRVRETRHRGTGEITHILDNLQFTDGYLLKYVSLKSLDSNNVVPTLDELQKFRQHLEDGGGGSGGMGGGGGGGGGGAFWRLRWRTSSGPD